MTDEEVYNLISGIQPKRDVVDFNPSLGDFLITPIFRITSDAVAKKVSSQHRSEAYVMQYVTEFTDILIPRVRRVLPERQFRNEYWIVMDFVDGQTLLELWPRMSWWRRLYVVWTLRRYFHQLHAVPLPKPDIPGPFDGSGHPLLCYSPQFPWKGIGPFASYGELARWHDYQRYCHQVRLHEMFRELWRCPKFDMSAPLVLSHGDLHLRNVMVDGNGRVWLLDWGCAGVYPQWWDFTRLAVWADAGNLPLRLPKSFVLFMPFIVGNYWRLYQDYWKKLSTQMETVEYDALEKEEGYFDRLGIDIDVDA